MPYTTERGVTTYRDNDTPPEFATGEDEERDAYNTAQDEAYAAAEKLLGLIDDLYEPRNASTADMQRIRDQINAIVTAVEQVTQ